MKNGFVLIGMPASGKSTVGVILAKILGISFVDADIAIQNAEHRKLHEIISQDGIDGFNAIEDRVNASLDPTNCVIATGGSAVYGENAMRHYQETATIIYLKVNFDVLEQRLSDIEGRGVVIREGQTLQDLYDERCALYEKYADITVDESDGTVEDVIRMIQEKIQP